MKDDDSWKVKSSSTYIAYLVRKETDICQYNCFIMPIMFYYAFITLNDTKIPCSTFMKKVCDASNTKSETNIKDRILKN